MIARVHRTIAWAESGAWSERAEGPLVFLGALALVAVAAGSTGGYLPTTWGWTAVITLWAAILAIILRRRLDLGVLELVFLGALLAFAGWMALSNLWSPSVTSTMLEVQRALAYVGIVAATLLLARRRTVPHLLGGTLGGVAVISLYALATRVVPDRVASFNSVAGGYRLSAPITYWNALGLFAAIGTLIALGLAARGRSTVGRALSAASLAISLPTVYFTFSRGAWFALAVGILLVLAVDARRLQLLAFSLALVPFAGLIIVASSSKSGLTNAAASFEEAVADGHALLPVLLAAALGLAAVTVLFAVVERRTQVSRAVRRAFVIGLACALVVLLGVLWSQKGSPVAWVENGWSAFKAPPNPGTKDLSKRLFQLSNNGRLVLWEAAWEEFESQPLTGGGAGSFGQVWASAPDRPYTALDAHSLYAETLGELGIVGAAFLAAVIGAVVAAGVRVRREPYAAAALGGFTAWVAQAGVDWEWEFVGVTGVAMLCAAALLVSDRENRGFRWPDGLAWRTTAGAVLAGASLFAFAGLLSAESLDRAAEDLAQGDFQGARAAARSAGRWAPWSSTPLQMASLVSRADGNLEDARKKLREATRRDPNNWNLWLDLAIISRGASRSAALERARELNPRGMPTTLPPPPA